jgi:hypothetical protein
MHRLIVLILSAVDAAIAAAVGIAATLAPLTLLWVIGLGGTADWAALWPASATTWQFGNLVPLQVTLPGDYLAVAGIDPAAASFVLSLAPLAFAGFTAIFAARSGVRASQADAWLTGVLTGALGFTALTALIALTSANAIAEVERWQAILFPALLYAVPLLVGALVTEWREAGSGAVARLRDRIEAAPHGWGAVAGLTMRGSAAVLAGLLGLGALVFAVSLVLRGGEVIGLFEAADVDVLGATVVTVVQLAYVPTLAIWGMAFLAGPGFAVGTGTAVSPAGTQLGVLPGIPVLGALPESTTPWLLLLALLPVGLGAFAGWIARSRLVAEPHAAVAGSPADAIEWDAASEAARSSALEALLSAVPSPSAEEPEQEPADRRPTDPIGPRLVIALGIAVLSGAGAALLSVLASGSLGPGRLADVGPQPGPVALAVGLEVLLGAAILLLSPRRRTRRPRAADVDRDAAPERGVSDDAVPADVRHADADRQSDAGEDAPHGVAEPPEDRSGGAPVSPDADTAPIALVPPAPRPAGPDADLGPRRPRPLPPID